VLIPELRAGGVNLAVINYPREPHCFAFRGGGPSTPRPAAALQAFQEVDAFFRRHLKIQPTPMDPALIEHISVN
jgi:dienelactone hydrolase